MPKGELSREFILESSMAIFNTHGYMGTSLQQVMDKTGFTKGGIYRHFSSKEALAVEAFQLAYKRMKAAYRGSFDKTDPPDVKLLKFLQHFKLFLVKPPVKGGCPILNSSTEVDDTNEVLRAEVRKAAADWEKMMTAIFEEGKDAGIFKPDTNSKQEAILLISTIEGAIMLSKLHRSMDYGKFAAEMLMARVRSLKP